MNFISKTLPLELHLVALARDTSLYPKAKITVDFDSPAGLMGKHSRKCKPTMQHDGSITVRAFRGTWQAIPVQVSYDGKPVMIRWESKHICWND